MDNVAVRVLNLSKRYKLYGHPWHRMAEWASLGQVQRHADFWALKRVTILFVSHDLWRVEALCNRAVYLNHGLIQSADSTDVVIKHYLDDLETQAAQEAGNRSKEESPSLGNGAGESDLEPGTGVIRWRVDGGVLYPRKYVLHASISTWDGGVYDTHYDIGNLLILGQRPGSRA